MVIRLHACFYRKTFNLSDEKNCNKYYPSALDLYFTIFFDDVFFIFCFQFFSCVGIHYKPRCKTRAGICHLWQGLNLSQHPNSNYINGFCYKALLVTESNYGEYLSI